MKHLADGFVSKRGPTARAILDSGGPSVAVGEARHAEYRRWLRPHEVGLRGRERQSNVRLASFWHQIFWEAIGSHRSSLRLRRPVVANLSQDAPSAKLSALPQRVIKWRLHMTLTGRRMFDATKRLV